MDYTFKLNTKSTITFHPTISKGTRINSSRSMLPTQRVEYQFDKIEQVLPIINKYSSLLSLNRWKLSDLNYPTIELNNFSFESSGDPKTSMKILVNAMIETILNMNNSSSINNSRIKNNKHVSDSLSRNKDNIQTVKVGKHHQRKSLAEIDYYSSVNLPIESGQLFKTVNQVTQRMEEDFQSLSFELEKRNVVVTEINAIQSNLINSIQLMKLLVKEKNSLNIKIKTLNFENQEIKTKLHNLQGSYSKKLRNLSDSQNRNKFPMMTFPIQGYMLEHQKRRSFYKNCSRSPSLESSRQVNTSQRINLGRNNVEALGTSKHLLSSVRPVKQILIIEKVDQQYFGASSQLITENIQKSKECCCYREIGEFPEHKIMKKEKGRPPVPQSKTKLLGNENIYIKKEITKSSRDVFSIAHTQSSIEKELLKSFTACFINTSESKSDGVKADNHVETEIGQIEETQAKLNGNKLAETIRSEIRMVESNYEHAAKRHSSLSIFNNLGNDYEVFSVASTIK